MFGNVEIVDTQQARQAISSVMLSRDEARTLVGHGEFRFSGYYRYVV